MRFYVAPGGRGDAGRSLAGKKLFRGFRAEQVRLGGCGRGVGVGGVHLREGLLVLLTHPPSPLPPPTPAPVESPDEGPGSGVALGVRSLMGALGPDRGYGESLRASEEHRGRARFRTDAGRPPPSLGYRSGRGPVGLD